MKFKELIAMAIDEHERATNGQKITLNEVKAVLWPDSNQNTRTARMSQINTKGCISIEQAASLSVLFPNSPRGLFLNHVDVVKIRVAMLNKYTTDELTFNAELRRDWNNISDGIVTEILINKYL